MSRKRGKLSLGEMEFIRMNCFDMSLEDIANDLNRTIEPIKKYIDKQNLKARDLTDDEHLLNELRERYYYKALVNQFTDAELIFYEHQWIDYYKQFSEDVVHTEEMQILEVIRIEILINRLMEERKDMLEQIARLQKLVDIEMGKDDPDTQAIAIFQTQLGSLYSGKSAYNGEYDKLVIKKNKELQSLKGTREQRKKVADDAKTNFTAWLRHLSKESEQEMQAMELEVHRIAADKARDRLTGLHTFEDQTVDPPILDSESIEHIEYED